MRTNTGLEFYWTRNGEKDLLTLNTSANGPLKTSITVNHQSIMLMSVVLLPLGQCGPSYRKNVQNNWEAHEFQQGVRSNCGRRQQCRTGIRQWSGKSKCWSAYTKWREQKRRLDETMADDGELYSTQHDVQKSDQKANYTQIAWRSRKTNW